MQSEAAPGLVDVSGIGETYAGVLATVGVTDASELAREDPDDLARRLAEAGHPHGVQRVSNWIAEARRVTQEPTATEGEQPSTAGATAAAAASDQLATSTDAGAGPRSAGDENDQLAAFTVFFEGDATGDRSRIRVYHEESGEQRTIEGIDPVALLRFMLVDAPAATPDPVPAAFVEAARLASFEPAPPDVARSVDGVEVSIVDVAVGTVSPPHRRVEPWLEVAVRFDVTGLDAHPTDAEVAYLCEVLLIERESRKLRTIISRYGQLDVGDGSYRATQELPLPPVGAYDIETVVLLLPPVEAVACRRGRPLTITP